MTNTYIIYIWDHRPWDDHEFMINYCAHGGELILGIRQFCWQNYWKAKAEQNTGIIGVKFEQNMLN